MLVLGYSPAKGYHRGIISHYTLATKLSVATSFAIFSNRATEQRACDAESRLAAAEEELSRQGPVVEQVRTVVVVSESAEHC